VANRPCGGEQSRWQIVQEAKRLGGEKSMGKLTKWPKIQIPGNPTLPLVPGHLLPCSRSHHLQKTKGQFVQCKPSKMCKKVKLQYLQYSAKSNCNIQISKTTHQNIPTPY